MKPKYKAWLKALLSLVLLFLVFQKVDTASLKQNLQFINIPYLIGVFFLSLSFLFIPAARTRFLVNQKLINHLGLRQAFSINLSGMFYNNILPTTVGGDIYRAFLLNYYLKSPQNSAVLVVMERICGIYATFFLLLLGSVLANGNIIIVPYLNIILIAFVSLQILVLVLFFWSYDTFNGILARLPLIKRYSDLISPVFSEIKSYKDSPCVLGILFLCSMLYQTADVLVSYFLACVAGIQLPINIYFLVIPLLYLVTLLPISINGLGVRENFLVYMLALLHVPDYRALLLSLLIYLDRVIKGLIGGLLILSKNIMETRKAEQEL